ncbi:MAG: heavy metal translocating P-type ATPase [Rhodanobacteraceae bacterium]|jgi:heavy metal translocating P-type ATPase|nr:heavy metal translocating P-type ATPase [Rhodanobacteraceae bacterium]
MNTIETARTTNRLLTILSALTLALGLLALLAGRKALADVSFLAGSVPLAIAILASIVIRLLRRDMGVDVIALLAIGGALALGEYLTASVIGLMFSTGKALEDYAEGRAMRAMSALLGRVPRTARRYDGEELVQVPIDSVVPGDRLLVRSGEVVPVDGLVDSAMAVLDESALTGEPLPLRRARGELVRSGVLNAAAPFDLLATTSAADSTFTGIVRLVEEARCSKAPSTRLADRYGLVFIPLSIIVAAVAWAISGDPVRALAVLVVATPCPMILAVPIAIVSGMSRCASRGVLIKRGGVLEQLARGHVLFFDKTGTLTAGHARLTAIEAAGALDTDELLRTAASLEQASQHVLAEAIVSFARQRGLRLSRPSAVHEEHGAGLTGSVDGRTVVVGSHAFVSRMASPADWADALHRRVRDEAATGVFVAVDGAIAGALLLGDEIRLDTPRALRLLRRAKIGRIVMLTGDHRDIAEAIGDALGVDEVLAGQTPADKLRAIEAARNSGTTIMVGDGINDAPALAAADVGVAMGARGAAASSEAAGIVLLVDRLDRLAEALAIARRTRRIAIESVIVGMSLSLVAMAVAALGYLPPIAGAILQEGIDVAAILNALRALRVRAPHGTALRLNPSETDRLRQDHLQLAPVLDRIRACADRLPTLSSDAVRAELVELNALVRSRLLAHEQEDERTLYPKLEPLIGGDDPLAAMSRTHREIFRLGHQLQKATDNLLDGHLPATGIQDLQRALYGLDAILRLHFAQEDEIYHAITEAAA